MIGLEAVRGLEATVDNGFKDEHLFVSDLKFDHGVCGAVLLLPMNV